jgi:uncharacterized membrane protein YedE/YeeE
VDPAVLDPPGAGRSLGEPVAWWQLGLVAGILLGAWCSARLSGSRHSGIAPVWAKALGTPSVGVRMITAGGGGFLVVFGAGIADGCISGHGLSGLAQMAVSSLVAVLAMFAGGIAVAHLLKRF